MKKIFAMILALILIFSISIPAFAKSDKSQTKAEKEQAKVEAKAEKQQAKAEKKQAKEEAKQEKAKPNPNSEEYGHSLSKKRDYLILVNETHPYEFGGEYDTLLQKDIVYLPDPYGGITPVEKGAAAAFLELQKALKKKGMTIDLYSAYMSESDQQWAYDYYSNLPGWGETNKVAKPGFSENHTGLLLNILILYQGENDPEPIWYTETAERQETIPYFKLLHETLADYGFIDRYPKGKEAITGIPCQPYLIRFVGSKQVAREITNSGLCLEEYLQLHPHS